MKAEVYGWHAEVAALGVHDAVVVGEGEGAGAALGGGSLVDAIGGREKGGGLKRVVVVGWDMERTEKWSVYVPHQGSMNLMSRFDRRCCRLTKSVAGDQRNGWEWEIRDCCEQREETGAVGSRVGVRFIQFQALRREVRKMRATYNAFCTSDGV